MTAPEQDTAVVDDAPLLPQQPKKPRKDTSVASDAGHSPADIKGKYHIMKYDTHGKDGTYAVRLKGGQQFTENPKCDVVAEPRGGTSDLRGAQQGCEAGHGA